ncbi:MAG: fibronectin type III domain-containing protein [Cytophagales bacterium]|nr:fibronectin type III domain-containing protein [Cytophagales bacterium]
MNYRLLFPRNYSNNPNVAGGYPLIIMTHGFGERGNCWGTDCYWADPLWNTLNTLETRQIATVTSSSGALFSVGPSNLDNYANNQRVIIRTNIPGYNGLRRLIKVGGSGQQQAGATQFRLSTNLTSTSPTANIVSFTAGFSAGTLEYPQANTHRISAAASGGGNTTIFTTDTPHQFVVGQDVIIRNSTVGAYNGTRNIAAVTANTFTVNNLTYSATAIANVARTGVFELLNNDHSMTHGGAVHQTAILTTTPAGMIPSDPTMPLRAFPGFMLYPQNLNGWEQGGAENAVRIIRLLMKKYNIDPNKIYVHGLSDGGSAVYRLVRTAPWLFAAALPMSAVRNPENSYPIYPYINSVPLWVFQGGQDTNPFPWDTEELVSNFRNAGMDVRYTLYPTLGHGTWNAAYAEQDFFRWMLLKDKADIQFKFNNRTVCGTSGAPAELILAQGFLAYQWEKDGVIIPGATSANYSAFLPGIYRARFSRKLNPTESDWNHWSKPVVVTEVTPPKPVVQGLNSTVFPTINNNQLTVLKANDNNAKYYWFKNGTPVDDARSLNGSIYYGTPPDTLSMLMRDSWSASQYGNYTVKVASISGCQSLSSDPIFFSFNTNANLIAPSNFAGTAQNGSTIFLSWNDNSLNETGFEIWRRKAGETLYKFVALTKEDVISYTDTNLNASTIYQYKIRAVGNTTINLRSNYVPGADDINTNLQVLTPGDLILPTPPQNLEVTFNTINSITLSWDPGTDNSGVKRYKVTRVNGTNTTVSEFTTDATTTHTLNGLTINTAYRLTVQTEDLAGNLSPPSNQIIGTTYIEGLYYEHSTGAWTSLDPNKSAQDGNTPAIDWVSAEFTGKWPNFNVNPKNVESGIPGFATQEDFYKIKFDGYLNITASGVAGAGSYRFRTTSDDGSMLFINGFDPDDLTQFRQVNNDGLHGPITVEAPSTISLSAGANRIVVLFNEYTGGQSLLVEYSRNGGAWTVIPDAMLRTGIYTPPTPPSIPYSLSAIAAGMTSVNLTWQYSGPAAEFEVYRASAPDTTVFNIIARATSTTFTDNTVLPGTEYFYKVRSVNANGTSAPSNRAYATTSPDGIPPTIPLGLTLISKTFTNVAFSWTESIDNVGVTGYEILINDNPVGTTAVTSYMATDLEPGTTYNFTVKAYDATGNKSAASSPVLQVTTNSGVMYYSKPTGALNVAGTWGTNTNGTGTAPNLTYNGQYYMVANRDSTGLGGSLTIGGSISKLIVPAGTTLTVDNTISAKLEVQGNAVVNLNNTATAPEFVSVSPTSTVNFNSYAYIPAGTYGHVNLTGTGNKNFAEGETVIMGNLTATTGIALKGVPGNTSHVTVYGDITLAGTPGVVATDNALDLTLTKPGTQTVTVSGPLDLYKLSTNSGTNVNVVNGGSAITLNVGSPNGGGLALANGTTLNLGNNHLVLKNAATLNAGGLTGKLAINGSNLTLASSSTQNSNLYFDATLKTAGLVTTTFSGSGKLFVQSPLNITDGLKIKAGEVSSAGNITLVSTQTKTAYLQEIEGNGTATGKFYVQRWVSAARKYRYMSSSVANMTVALWQQYMPINGPFTGASSSAVPSAFYYVENDGGYKNFPANGSNNLVTFVRGRGYSIFNYNGNNPLTLTMTGNPYQGSVPFTLTPGTGSTANGGDGWNLVGNPYASAIQWNNLASDWTRSGISPIVTVPDNTGSTLVFKTWDASTNQGTNGWTDGIIAPGQAFWVKAITANPTMTIHEKAKRTNTSTFYREGDAHLNSIAIRLSNGTAQDEGYVILGEAYSDAFEPETDGMKYKNQVLNVSTRSADNVNLVFNKLSDSFCEKTVTLNLEDVTPGPYTLAFDNIENLVGVGAITLTDHFTNTTVPITNSTPYSFAVTTAAASYGAGRFSLTLGRPALQKNASASVANVCGGTAATIQLANTQPGAFYYATRVNEATPISEVAGEAGMLTIPVSALQAGANSIVIHTGFKGCSDELLTATPLEFMYTPSPVVSVSKPFYSLCADSQVTLTAETNATNSLHWYKDGVLLANQSNTTWVSDPLKKTTLFEVAAVSNGCEGPKASVFVEINKVTMPIVEFDGNALEIVNEIPADNFIQWYINHSPMDAYDRGIIPKEEGIYTVLVAKGGCSVVSEPFEYLVTGVENPGGEPFQAYVYPNPATFDQLYVKLESGSKQNATVKMVDVTGRTIFTQLINGSEGNGIHKLNVAQDTTPGLYIIQIQQGNAVLQRKVILQFK